MQIKKIGVVGGGIMGSGIAQVASSAGYDVVLNDIEDRFLDRAFASISDSLERMVKKEKITPDDKKNIIGRINRSTSLDDLSDADFVVEAVIEDKALKNDIFRRLDSICRKEIILASNTSSISITSLAAATSRQDKVIGMHFINPVPVMKLIEIIKGLDTSDETTDTVFELSRKMGKVPVMAEDFPGFVSNRVLQVMINEGIYCLYEGVGTREAIDDIMKMCANHPMGPLELADLIGLDTVLNVLNVIYEGYGNPKYYPCPLLKKYVEAGFLGRKTGRGFYEYK
ncbi:MAG: 3-hydroxybutyryl-CoA dehydrogenase [Deltaproteobacteria bacterium]|nr:MAG: 3-hydroxybutyryl-CoA dehydrogenase [Deltaproteobacteria bacterium]